MPQQKLREPPRPDDRPVTRGEIEAMRVEFEVKFARLDEYMHRRMHEPIGFTGTFEGNAARARNERALALEKPRVTKQSREEAKPHPSTWPSQEGEP